jgi:hypothetical protein
MNLEPENRRSFVKKSLATSMTLTFAGLIRAHGDGGTGGTTIDPENTDVTTNSGTTTTIDLEGTYYTTIGHSTTFDVESTYQTTTYDNTTTWNPEETISTTILETTSPCPCKFLEKVEIVFDESQDNHTDSFDGSWTNGASNQNQNKNAIWERNEPQNNEDINAKKSGKRYWGRMRVTKVSCHNPTDKIFMTFIVYTGGHRALSENQTTTSPGSSTGIPAGEHRMESKTDNLDVADGCKVSSHNGSLGTRSEIELHNPGTSTGCIVVSKKGRQHGDQMGPLFRHFNEFQKFIEPSCECSSSCGKNHANRLIPLFVWYNVPGDSFRGNKGKIDNNQNVPGENPSSQIPNFSDDEIAPHSETKPE